MNVRTRSWLFRHPDLDPAGRAPGLGLRGTGGIAMVEDHRAIRQALLLLISTRPGERLMRPDYGCDLSRLVFAPCDDTTAGLAMHAVRQAVSRWEPRVKILRLDATFDREAPARLNITLDYVLRRTGASDTLAFGVDLAGENSP